LDLFKISPEPVNGAPWITGFESVAYPGVFLRMDASDLPRNPQGGGKVNKQFGQSYYELFTIRRQTDGSIAIESYAFPQAYLRLSKGLKPGPTAVVNCRLGLGDSEKFRLEEPPLLPRLRILSYNTHLMQGSFIDLGILAQRTSKRERVPYAVWDDMERRDLIIRNIVNSGADIVALQEIWEPNLVADFANKLKPFYPYSFVGDTQNMEYKIGPTSISFVATSGLLLCSKFKLTDRSFARFPNMKDLDALSNKGVLGAVANLPDKRQLRIVTAHTTGEVRDIQFIADKIIISSAELRALPTIALGDFNISWDLNGDNNEYKEMKKIFAGRDLVADSWLDVHADVTEADPYSVKMRENTLHQLFSPRRDTEPDTRLDYLWVKTSKASAWSPKTASVQRGNDWLYESPRWHWAHNSVVKRMASAAAQDKKLLLVVSNGHDEALMGALFDQKTSKWSHYNLGFKTSASPGVIYFKNKFHLFYRDQSPGNAIFHRSSDDGRTWSDRVNTGINTGGACCPVEYLGDLHLLYVDPDGHGGQIFCNVKTSEWNDFGPRYWGGRAGTGINTESEISAAVFDNTLYVVCKDHGAFERTSSGLMWSTKVYRDDWKWRQADRDLVTSGSPGVVAFGNRLHIYYQRPGTDAIFHAEYDGQRWLEKDKDTLHDSVVYGVCPVVFDDKLWLFYPYYSALTGYYPNLTMLHTQIPTPKVDLSDHYPLMVELEPPIGSVNIRGSGVVLFCEGNWAGTRGKATPLDGFVLRSPLPNLHFRYKAHVQNTGDTEWKNDGEYAGSLDELAIEGFTIKLTGTGASLYRLSYRAHLQNQGDTEWTKEGEFCGTTQQSRAVEAIYIRLERK